MFDFDWSRTFDWTSVNWGVIATLVAAICGVASRFFVGWWASRIKEIETAAVAIESEAERQARVNNEQYERERAEALRYIKRFMDLERDHDALWEQARGMEVWAHYFRHYGLGISQQYQMCCYLMEQLATNSISPGRAAGFAAKLISSMPAPPPPVPLLNEAIRPPPPLFSKTLQQE